MFNESYLGKRVLVTGHTGFKGAWLSQWLIRLGAKVCGYSLYIPSNPSIFEVLGLASQMQDVRADVRDLDSLQKTFDDFQPEVVFHLAAQPIVLTAYEDPKTTFDTNAGGTVNVLDAARQCSSVKAIVMITSDKCYENVEWDFGYRETDRLGGQDPYSASKACAEIVISSYCRSFFSKGPTKVASGRAGNVIGGGDWASNRIVPDAMRAWSEGEPVLLRNPFATRPWQHVLEPLSGYLRLGEALLANDKSAVSESFNFGPAPEVNHSVGELITAMLNCWKGDALIETNLAKAGQHEAGLLKLCCDKALRRLSWQACLPFDTLVLMVTEWYQAYYAGSTGMRAFTLAQIEAYESIAFEKDQTWAVGEEVLA